MADLDQIRVFLRVVERGGFTAAARQLDMPLTSVSRKIIALERDLGVRLFHRTTRRVSTTQAGQDFYERCLEAVDILDEAERAARMVHDEPIGLLRVLLPYALGLSVVGPMLAAFRVRYPKVRFELIFANQTLDLIEHGFDVALHRGPLPDSGYAFRRLARATSHLVASPDYLARHGAPEMPGDLPGHTLLHHGTAKGARWRLCNPQGAIAEVPVDPAIASNETMVLLQQALNGTGIALLSRQVTKRHIETGELVGVLSDWRRAEDVDLAALFPVHATTDRKVRVFVDFCVEIFAQWAREGALLEV